MLDVMVMTLVARERRSAGTEPVAGDNRRDRRNAGTVPPAAAMRIGAGVASALAALHAAGVVHCDVKPTNITLVDDGVKLVDCGIATVVGGRPPGSRDGQVGARTDEAGLFWDPES